MAKLTLNIVTPEKQIFSGEVDQVTIPGAEGEFGVLPLHTTFLTSLGSGTLTYLQGGKATSVPVSGGFCEVRKESVTVLADSAGSTLQ